jgi:hypothetical protein
VLSIITESFGLHLIDATHLTSAKNLYQLSDVHLLMLSLSVKTKLSENTEIFVFSSEKTVHGISKAYFKRRFKEEKFVVGISTRFSPL